MKFLDELKKLNKLLVTVNDRMETAETRLGKLEDCCLELHKDFSKVASDLSHVPVVVDKMLLEHKVKYLEGARD